MGSQKVRYNWATFTVTFHIVKGFSVVNEAEVDVFLELSCFFYDPTDVGNLISGSSTFSKCSLNIWKFVLKFMFQVLLKPGLENFDNYFAGVWDEYNCAVVWAFFGIACLWDWNKSWSFQVLWPLLSFPNLLTYSVQHFFFLIIIFFTLQYCIGFHSIIFQDLK